jgi:hypothetical protein
MRIENRDAAQEPMEDDHGRGQDPYRVEVPVRKNKKVTQNMVRVNNTKSPTTLKKLVIWLVILKTVLFTSLCNAFR